jgi:RHS repeat-associated protein
MTTSSYLGTIKGGFGTDANGGATYTIALAVPPGTGGMEPSLSLFYNSGIGNGILGMGWGLRGLSAITRCPQTPAQDGAWRPIGYDESDRFALDGRRLMLVRGSGYGQPDAIYHTEIESWLQVVPGYANTPNRSGPDSFLVSTKNGRTLEYGSTPDSQVQASSTNPSIRVWTLNKVTDLNGNVLTITYQPDPNQGNTNYPLRIDYTGNGSLQPQRSVQFSYESRADWFSEYEGGFPFATTLLLTQIQTFLAGSLVRTYSLTYQSGLATGRSQLASVTEADSNGLALPPTVFAWQDGDPGFFKQSQVLPSTNQAWQGRLLPMDVNGDGLIDLVNAYSVNGDLQLTLMLSNGSAFTSSDVIFSQPSIPYFAGMQILPMDVNGNGCIDLVCAMSNNGQLGLTILSSQPGGNGSWTFEAGTLNGAQPTSPSLPWGGQLVPMDVNGDGRVDLVYAYSVAGRLNLAVLFSNGSDFTSGTNLVSTSIQYFASALVIGLDFNGDTMADLLYVYQNGTSLSSALFLSSGTTLVQQPSDPFSSSPPPNLGTLVALDVNEDGLGDVVQAYLDGDNLVVQTFCSNGISFESPISQNSFGLTGLGAGVPSLLPADVNGDGLPDLVVAIQAGNEVSLSVLLGTGAGFEMPNQAVTQPASSIPWPGSVLPMDFNGDGKTDLVFAYSSNGALTLAVMTASGPYPDLMTTITNGLGGVFEVTYAPLTDPSVYAKNDALPPSQAEPQGLLNNQVSGSTYPISSGALGSTSPTSGAVPGTQSVDFPKYVVASYSKSDGQGSTYSYGCSYAAALVDLTGHGWLGFAALEVIDEDFQTTTLTDFIQEFPLTRSVASTTLSRSTDGALMQVVTQGYQSSESPANAGVYLTMVNSIITDFYTFAAPSPPPTPDCTESKAFSFDDFGNPLSTSITGNAYGAPLYLFETYLNQVSAGEWLIGFKTESKTTADSAGTRVLIWRQFAYDPSTMNLASEMVWDDQNETASQWETMTYQYDSFGNRLSMEDPSQALTQWVYEGVYNTFLEEKISPPNQAGQSLNWQYRFFPQFGAEQTETDPNNVVTTEMVDGLGRLIEVQGPTPTGETVVVQQITWGTDDTGTYRRVETLVDWSGTTRWRKEYLDGLSRVYATAELGPDGFSTVWVKTTFNSKDLIVTQSLPYNEGSAPLLIQNTYDNYARLVKVQQPQGDGVVLTELSYQTVDDVTQTEAVGQPDARTTLLSYSRFNAQQLLVSQTDANGAVTTYGYDGLGRPASVVDGIGVVTSFGYDSLNRIIAQAVQSGTTVLSQATFQYDDLNRTVTRVDGRLTQVTQLYDALGRLISRTVVPLEGDSAVTTYTFDDTSLVYGLGRCSSIQMPVDATYDYTYDACGNQVSTTLTLDGGVYETQKTFSPGKLVTGAIYPDGSTQSNAYNAAEQLWTVSFQAATAASGLQTLAAYAEYSAFGAPGQVSYGNGTEGIYTYDATGRLSSQELTASSTAIANHSYTWNDFNAASEIGDQLDTTNSQSFVYDPVGRVLQAIGAYPAQTYAYDNGGNLSLKDGIVYTSLGYQVQEGLSDGGTVFSATYDANGNMISAVRGGATTSYEYDGDNQLTGVGSTLFSYDYAGRRITTRSGDGATIYFVSPEYEVIALADGSRRHTIYVPGLRGVIASSTTVEEGVGPLVSEIFYLYANNINSTTIQTDTDANVVTTLAYLPYGEQYIVSGLDNVAQKFTGKRWDSQIGLYYYGARYYDPGLGRFITADDRPGGSVGQRDVWNLYAYCLNDPVNNTDPTGHDISSTHFNEVAFLVDIGLFLGAVGVLATTPFAGPWSAIVGSTLLGMSIGGLIYNSTHAKANEVSWRDWGIQLGIGAAMGLVAGVASAAAGAAAEAALAGGRTAFAIGGGARIALNVGVGALGNAGVSAGGQVLNNLVSNTALSSGVWVAALVGGVAGGLASVGSEFISIRISRPMTLDEYGDWVNGIPRTGEQVYAPPEFVPRKVDLTRLNKLRLADPAVIFDLLGARTQDRLLGG